MHYDYPRGHMTRIMILDTPIVLIGLAMIAGPFVTGGFPGALDTTDHVGLGALIAALAVFRVLVAYGSIWIDVCLFALGLITFSLPTILHMRWDARYNTGHMLAGGLIMALSVIAALSTMPALRQRRRLHD